jgi:raffinose/stachyose/melibiose transport system substrate-binding protein
MLKVRRIAAVAASLAVAATALAACGGSDSGGSANELRLWHYEGPDSAMGVAPRT